METIVSLFGLKKLIYVKFSFLLMFLAATLREKPPEQSHLPDEG